MLWTAQPVEGPNARASRCGTISEMTETPITVQQNAASAKHAMTSIMVGIARLCSKRSQLPTATTPRGENPSHARACKSQLTRCLARILARFHSMDGPAGLGLCLQARALPAYPAAANLLERGLLLQQTFACDPLSLWRCRLYETQKNPTIESMTTTTEKT